MKVYIVWYEPNSDVHDQVEVFENADDALTWVNQQPSNVRITLIVQGRALELKPVEVVTRYAFK